MIFLKWACLNLLRHKRRNVTTALTITSGIIGLLLLWSYIYRMGRYLTDSTVYINRNGHAMITKVDALKKEFEDPLKYSLTLEQQQKINILLSQEPRVSKFGPELVGTALISNGCKSFPTYIKSIDPELDSYIFDHQEVKTWIPELAKWRGGKGFYQLTGDLAENSINLSIGLAQLLKKTKNFDAGPVSIPDCNKPETIELDNNIQISTISFKRNFSAVDAEVAGSFSTGLNFSESSLTLMPFKKAQKLYDTDNASRVILFLKDIKEIKNLYNDLKIKLSRIDPELEISMFDHPEIGFFYTGTIQFLYTMAGFFLFLIVIAILFSIGNQMTLSIVERSKEIGTLMSIGYNKQFLKKLFLIEAIFVNTIGCFLGLILAYLIMYFVNSLGFVFSPPGVSGAIEFKLYLPIVNSLILFVTLNIICFIGAYFIFKSKLRTSIVNLLTDTVT